MAYYAKSLDTVQDTSYRTKELTLQVTGKSSNMGPTAQLLGLPRRTSLSNTHLDNSYATVDNSQIQAGMGLTMVQTMMPTQTNVSSHSSNLTTVTSSGLGMQQMGQLILQSPKLEEGQRDQERRIRREIANSNERRRMQSINAGFKSLKTILPHTDGEKLSKAAILQQTSEYITQLEADKLKLLHQNEKLRRAFTECKCNSPKHRAIVCDIFDKDEGIGSPAEEDFEDMRRGILEVRKQLDKERRMRLLLEEQVRNFDAQMYPEKIRDIKQRLIPSTSSDERRSSSDYSPCSSRQDVDPFDTGRSQNCARPLLPPLAPLVTTAPSEQALPMSVDIEKKLSIAPVYGIGPNSLIIPASLAYRPDCPTELSLAPNKTVVYPKDCGLKVSHSQSLPESQHVTVFSHSTNSNQPLKKRAIEVHETFSEAHSHHVASQQPKNKIAKISVDVEQAPEIGTRSFLPPTLPPISISPLQIPPPVVQTLPLPQRVSSSEIPIQPHKPNFSLYSAITTAPQPIYVPVASVSTTRITPRQISATIPYTPPNTSDFPTQSQILGPNVTEMTPITPQRVFTSNPTMIPLSVSPTATFVPRSGNGQIENGKLQPSVPMSSPLYSEAKRELYTVFGGNNIQTKPSVGNPVYLTVGTAPTNSNYIQPVVRQNLDCVTLTPSTFQPSHLVVTPLSLSQTQNVLIRDTSAGQHQFNETIRNSNLQMTYRPMIDSRQLMNPNISLSAASLTNVITHSAVSAVQTTSQCVSRPKAQNPSIMSNIQCSATTQPQPDSMIQCPNLSKVLNSPHQALPILCYRPPELTLNQLNAVPNLPPPRSLHQPLLLPATPSLVHQLSSGSPSYVSSTALTDTVLPARISYPHYNEVRRRKSSFSATDSCSTASISGAEEEETKNPLLDDPDSQSGDSIPTIKLCNATEHPSGTSPRRRTSQHSSTESLSTSKEVLHSSAQAKTPNKSDNAGTDVPDSVCVSTATSTTLSVLSSVAGSPPVIRRIDAIQTRRNLETIVQAIDHLEQQERRNSQDQGGMSPHSPTSPTQTTEKN